MHPDSQQGMVPCHPHRRTGLSSRFLVSAWFNPSCHRCGGSKRAYSRGSFLSLCVALLSLSNKLKMKRRGKKKGGDSPGTPDTVRCSLLWKSEGFTLPIREELGAAWRDSSTDPGSCPQPARGGRHQQKGIPPAT